MILFIDNYDSFTYNLVQMIGGLNPDIKVIRNDELTVAEIKDLSPSHIVLSPGPGYPKDAGVCEDVVRSLAETVPILGVCLGHQGICEVFGAEITRAKKLMHGKQSILSIDSSDPLFQGLENKIPAARYHSLIARKETLPSCLKTIGTDDMGEIMAVKHKNYAVYGLQFHPESILTPNGESILKNFLSITIHD
ncbi:anthranilate synthase component II [Lacrimispora algidixylanolytica]|uniref:Aminodeoxychorismate/anthranilate synthase component II n=1 Tax=Lacrimispora algidixylanolytica TaxID=94868 RepID=A0A419T677_9FIRM|nr:aminodeoxychorismate/anthranilate synthase component II [Lacrimispora algidixylanolytica]RKD33064.1 aminodeoxychorismate/anthranilate synthase component II [Lacrimispora algidixylanolytica]